jgi:hypothetical protein
MQNETRLTLREMAEEAGNSCASSQVILIEDFGNAACIS